MKPFRTVFISICILIGLFSYHIGFASDFIIKYYIFSMKTPQDREKVVGFIKGFEGVMKVETKLDRHWVYLYLEDDIMEEERSKIRLPLGKLGYPVERWEVQLEKPDSHE